MNINKKLLCWFLPVVLLPLGFFAYLSYSFATNQIVRTTTGVLAIEAGYKTQQIKRYFAAKKGNLELLASVPFVINSLEEFYGAFKNAGIASPEYAAVDEKYRAVLKRIQGKEGIYDAFLISPEGDVVFSVAKEEDLGTNLNTGIYKDSEFAQAFRVTTKLLETTCSNFEYYQASNRPAAFISTPVFKEGRFIGVMAIQVNNDEIYNLVNDYAGLGETGETVIALHRDNQAVIIAPLRHDPYAAFRRKVDLGSKNGNPIQEAVLGKKGSGIFFDYRAIKSVAAWQYLPDLRWGIVAKIDAQEAFAEVAKLRNLYLLFGTIALFLGIIMVVFVSKGISLPIKKLEKAAIEMSKGNLDVKVGITSKDEIGHLASVFDLMIKNLKVLMQKEKEFGLAEARVEAEKKVANELRALNQQLTASEQQLLAGQQQLRASNQQLANVEQELRVANTSLEGKIKERTKELEEAKASLEVKVEERTVELRGKMKELQVFYNACIGREERILDLKKEVIALKKELGRPS